MAGKREPERVVEDLAEVIRSDPRLAVVSNDGDVLWLVKGGYDRAIEEAKGLDPCDAEVCGTCGVTKRPRGPERVERPASRGRGILLRFVAPRARCGSITPGWSR